MCEQRQLPCRAFNFYGIATGLHKRHDRIHSLTKIFTRSQERHITNNKFVWRTTFHSGNVRGHHIDCRVYGAGEAVHDHG